MKTRSVLSALMMSLALVIALAPAAFARGELVAEPGRINFGSVDVNCEVVDASQTPDCPTLVVTFTNTTQSPLTVDGLSPCGRILGPNPTCETSYRFPGWGGFRTIENCFTPLAPGGSCSVTIVATPRATGPIHGYIAAWSGTALILCLPVAVRGT